MTTSAPRRELVLEAAADLFAARGFHAVGMDDIGEAAGISGPGVYRHFPSKQALLETLLDRTMDRMLETVRGIEDLETLIDAHVDLVVSDQALISVWVREQRTLAEPTRQSLRLRMRTYEGTWRTATRARRPELADEELALTVGAALALLNTSSLIESRLSPTARATVLRRQALAALLSA